MYFWYSIVNPEKVFNYAQIVKMVLIQGVIYLALFVCCSTISGPQVSALKQLVLMFAFEIKRKMFFARAYTCTHTDSDVHQLARKHASKFEALWNVFTLVKTKEIHVE